MQVQIWSSFSCNNSSDYRLVARFRDPHVAARMADELAAFFMAYGASWDAYCEEHDYSIPEHEPLPAASELAARYGVAWNAREILAWGDEGLADNEPAISVVGGTLAIFHDYCGGFTDNLTRVLTAAGAEVEPEMRCPPDVSVRFTLPDGEAGETMARELAAFCDQKGLHEYMSDFASPPWGDHRLMGDPSSIFWYRDGQQVGFKLPLIPEGLDALKTYLANVRDLDLRLCDAIELASFEMRDTLAELDARLATGEVITELDLTERRLRYVPAQVLAMSALKKLVLDENPLELLPESIAQLTQLEELHLENCPLSTLPPALSRLPLRVLDISGTKLATLPAVITQIPTLRELQANRLPKGSDVSALAGVPLLEVLGLGFLRPTGDGVMSFPRVILGLRALRALDLSYSALDGIPDEITDLQALETLKLQATLGHVAKLPPLHRLPKLTTLLMNGNAGNTGKYAPHTVLDGVWKITTLQHLGIDRYGAQQQQRPALTALPDDAFARMPHLRTLDLSFNELVTLPASFFTLTELESVDLQYTKLDRATLDQLRAKLARVRVDLRHVDTKVDVDDPHWRAVHAKVKEGASKVRGDRASAVAAFEEALAMCRTGTMYSDYDELYASYGCVDALGHLRLAVEGEERERLTDRLVEHATRALSLVPEGTIWHFTNEGAFQEEVIRRAGNALAWVLMERGELDRARAVVERALSVGGDNKYVIDTKVRILLKAGRHDEAYAIVHAMLAAEPSFADFQDLGSSPAYRTWLADRGRRR